MEYILEFMRNQNARAPAKERERERERPTLFREVAKTGTDGNLAGQLSQEWMEDCPERKW